MTDGKVPVRLRWLALFFALIFAALTTRLWFMQVLASQQYRIAAQQNGIRLVQDAAPRGRIYDRSGDLLVGKQLDAPAFRRYTHGDGVGQSGVEATYEPSLQGHKGEQKFKVNSSGKNLGPIGRAKQPVAGNDVVLSIDAHVQQLAQRSLA